MPRAPETLPAQIARVAAPAEAPRGFRQPSRPPRGTGRVDRTPTPRGPVPPREARHRSRGPSRAACGRLAHVRRRRRTR
eukprot:2927535-Prymnesium_polylepis.1